MNSSLAVSGLILDVAGAVLLASGLMLKKPRDQIREAVSQYDLNRHLLLSLIRQREDARFGSALLVAGFIAQALGATGIIAWDSYAVALPITFALTGLTLVAHRRKRSRHVRGAISAQIAGQWIQLRGRDTREADWRHGVEGWLTAEDFARTPGESVEDAARRLLGTEFWGAVDTVRQIPPDVDDITWFNYVLNAEKQSRLRRLWAAIRRRLRRVARK